MHFPCNIYGFIVNKMITLTELFQTNDEQIIKNELRRLANEKDYRTINTLLRRNPNISKFDTRALNEEIPQQEKHFVKRKGVMKNENKHIPFKERFELMKNCEAKQSMRNKGETKTPKRKTL